MFGEKKANQLDCDDFNIKHMYTFSSHWKKYQLSIKPFFVNL